MAAGQWLQLIFGRNEEVKKVNCKEDSYLLGYEAVKFVEPQHEP
jgi:hypothetical protein